MANVSIQAYLTAAVINLKRLVSFAGVLYGAVFAYLANILAVVTNRSEVKRFLGNDAVKFLRIYYDRMNRCEGRLFQQPHHPGFFAEKAKNSKKIQNSWNRWPVLCIFIIGRKDE